MPFFDFPHHLSVFVLIFFRNVILRHLVRVDFPLWLVLCIFDARHDVGLERIPFLEQLVDTFLIGSFNVAQSLQVSRLRTRTRSHHLLFECLGPGLAILASRFSRRMAGGSNCFPGADPAFLLLRG